MPIRQLSIDVAYFNSVNFDLDIKTSGNLDYPNPSDGATTHQVTLTDVNGYSRTFLPSSVSGDEATFSDLHLEEFAYGTITIRAVSRDVDSNLVTANSSLVLTVSDPVLNGTPSFSIDDWLERAWVHISFLYVKETEPVTVTFDNLDTGQSLVFTGTAIPYAGFYDRRRAPASYLNNETLVPEDTTSGLSIADLDDGRIRVTFSTVDEFDRPHAHVKEADFEKYGIITQRTTVNTDTSIVEVTGTTTRVTDGTVVDVIIIDNSNGDQITTSAVVTDGNFMVGDIDAEGFNFIQITSALSTYDKFNHSIYTQDPVELVTTPTKPSYREAINKTSHKIKQAVPNVAYGPTPVGTPVFLLQVGDRPTVTARRTGCAELYAGVVNRINSDGTLFISTIATVEDMKNLPPVDPGELIFLTLDGELTGDRLPTGICIGVMLTDQRVLIHDPINLTNHEDYAGPVANVKATLEVLIAQIADDLDVTLARVEASVLKSDYADFMSSNTSTLDSVKLDIDETANSQQVNEVRVTALEDAQVGYINTNVSHDNIDNILAIAINTTEVNEGTPVTISPKVTGQSLAVDENGEVSVDVNLSSDLPLGLFTLTASCVDRYGKTVSNTGTTTIVAQRALALAAPEIAANLELEDVSRTGRVYGRLRGDYQDYNVIVKLYTVSPFTGIFAERATVATDNGQGVYVFEVSGIDANVPQYAEINAIVEMRANTGALVQTKANKVYINSDGDPYTSDGTLGDSGDAFNAA